MAGKKPLKKFKEGKMEELEEQKPKKESAKKTTKKTETEKKVTTNKKPATTKKTTEKAKTETKTKGATKSSKAMKAEPKTTAKKTTKKVEEKAEIIVENKENVETLNTAENVTMAAEEKKASKAKTSKTAAKKTDNKKNKKVVEEKQEDLKEETKQEEKETPKKVATKKAAKSSEKKTAKPRTITKAKTSKSSKKEETPKEIKQEEPYDVLLVEGYHHLKLYSYVYDKIQNAKAVVLIVHGMQEHAGRYEEFATFLNQHGYIVIANDLRGHGHTAIDKKFGFGENDIYQETVQDEIVMIEKIKDAYNLPVYLFGHSYGSMVCQSIIQNTDIVEKCVLCGTANGSSGIMKSGVSLAKLISLFKNDNSNAGLVEKMSIKKYGKGFEHGNWLSRDNEVIKRYKEDEYCGGNFPFGFYKSMLTNMKKVNKGINKIGNKKIFLIAGAKDPVGSCGKQVVKLNKLYLSNNIDSRCKIYPECRHELLNELNKDEVYQDVLNFYED